MDIYSKPTDICPRLPFSSSHPKHCNKNIPYNLARRICTIVENKQQKLRHLSELKQNLKKYDCPVNIITNGTKKALEIPQNELRKPREEQADEVLPLIFTSHPINSPIKNSVEVLKRNNDLGFESINLINSKRQPPNLQKLLTKMEFSNEEVGVRKCQDLRFEYCESLLLSKEYTFKNVNNTFTLKTPML